MVGGDTMAHGSERPEVRIDKELDLRGEVCPYTFVKSKLALEPMGSGEVLRVLVDYEPARTSVPQSMTAEGHQVLHVGEAPGAERVWEIIVRRA